MNDEETKIAFKEVNTEPPREILKIVPTETGFDVVIPDNVTLTEAAQKFIDMVNEMLQRSKEKNEY